MRTSETGPIRVDFVAQADLNLPGRLGLTIAPGKKDRWGQWDRDLDLDLRRLRDHYRVDCLASLMEAHEYRELHIADLTERAEKYGIAVHRFPIRDVDAPPAEAMTHFVELIESILGDVRAGKTVVIHCRGGLGRSGLVAASCLVRLGHSPADAIRRVRSARPGAVEVASQERWVELVAEALKGRPESQNTLGGDRSSKLSLAEVRAMVAVLDRELIPPSALFWHQSSLHGRAHVARVLVHAFRLIAATGFVEETSRLWASVYLHDIARRHDGVSRRHGADAWARLADLPEVRELFARGGVRDEDYPAIEAAVSGHSRGEPPPGHPHKRLMSLLKDADGLDRVRLGDLDPAYLRHPEAVGMVAFAERLYRATDGAANSSPQLFDNLWLEVVRLLAEQPQVTDHRLWNGGGHCGSD